LLSSATHVVDVGHNACGVGLASCNLMVACSTPGRAVAA